jgi:hypothetical protein
MRSMIELDLTGSRTLVRNWKAFNPFAAKAIIVTVMRFVPLAEDNQPLLTWNREMAEDKQPLLTWSREEDR